MPLPSSKTIDIGCLSRIYGNTVATYKFYWFVSIINLVCANPDRRVFSFHEIIAGMIAEAWYPIHYFRLSFGKSDSLEFAILQIQKFLNIPIDAEKKVVSEKILANADKPEVRKLLAVFTRNVPYRFLSPWIPRANDAQVELMSREFFNNCPYAISGKEIYINEPWIEYLTTNAHILRDFSYWNLTGFIQKRNPNVPDIPSKLVKPILRGNLSKQHRFWDRYIDATGPVHCIYTDIEMSVGDYDLDHFIPWSFVVHDQLWNLLPAHPSVNSSKSDNIPPLDRYLNPMAHLQHEALRVNYSLNQSDVLLEDYLVFRCSIPELVDLPADKFLSSLRTHSLLWRKRPPIWVLHLGQNFPPMSDDCVFCSAGSTREIIVSSALSLAFFDGFPVSPGHVLVVPRRHVASFFDLTEEEVADMMALMHQVKSLIDARFHPDGYNIGINVNEAAGQSVFHVHMHLIPRYSGDVPDPKGGVRGVIPKKQRY